MSTIKDNTLNLLKLHLGEEHQSDLSEKLEEVQNFGKDEAGENWKQEREVFLKSLSSEGGPKVTLSQKIQELADEKAYWEVLLTAAEKVEESASEYSSTSALTSFSGNESEVVPEEIKRITQPIKDRISDLNALIRSLEDVKDLFEVPPGEINEIRLGMVVKKFRQKLEIEQQYSEARKASAKVKIENAKSKGQQKDKKKRLSNTESPDSTRSTKKRNLEEKAARNTYRQKRQALKTWLERNESFTSDAVRDRLEKILKAYQERHKKASEEEMEDVSQQVRQDTNLSAQWTPEGWTRKALDTLGTLKEREEEFSELEDEIWSQTKFIDARKPKKKQTPASEVFNTTRRGNNISNSANGKNEPEDIASERGFFKWLFDVTVGKLVGLARRSGQALGEKLESPLDKRLMTIKEEVDKIDELYERRVNETAFKTRSAFLLENKNAKALEYETKNRRRDKEILDKKINKIEVLLGELKDQKYSGFGAMIKNKLRPYIPFYTSPPSLTKTLERLQEKKSILKEYVEALEKHIAFLGNITVKELVEGSNAILEKGRGNKLPSVNLTVFTEQGGLNKIVLGEELEDLHFAVAESEDEIRKTRQQERDHQIEKRRAELKKKLDMFVAGRMARKTLVPKIKKYLKVDKWKEVEGAIQNKIQKLEKRRDTLRNKIHEIGKRQEELQQKQLEHTDQEALELQKEAIRLEREELSRYERRMYAKSIVYAKKIRELEELKEVCEALKNNDKQKIERLIEGLKKPLAEGIKPPNNLIEGQASISSQGGTVSTVTSKASRMEKSTFQKMKPFNAIKNKIKDRNARKNMNKIDVKIKDDNEGEIVPESPTKTKDRSEIKVLNSKGRKLVAYKRLLKVYTRWIEITEKEQQDKEWVQREKDNVSASLDKVEMAFEFKRDVTSKFKVLKPEFEQSKLEKQGDQPRRLFSSRKEGEERRSKVIIS